ncbi:MAG: hypothetical protein OS130_03945 [Thermodesulfobacteriota bacterium]|jgi:hypothetical protein|nr:MAG: hypothetical protein OS130_03945 [Thermodesulfobacteriota bacterium]
MAVQTARITFLGTPEFKGWLKNEAKKEGVSIAELIRHRCLNEPNEDELLLLAMADEVKKATHRAKASLNKGLKDANEALAAIRRAKQ